MANLKWVNVSVDLDKLHNVFQCDEVQRQLVKKLGKGQLIRLVFMCLEKLKDMYEEEHKSYKEKEVLSTFEANKSVTWVKSCKTRKQNSLDRSLKCKEIISYLRNL